jgi:uncharacterized protein (DUF1499 family)
MMIWWSVALAAAGLFLIVGVVLVSQVDDWSRDLTQNTAATSDASTNQALRPVTSSLNPSDMVDVVVRVAAELPRWEHQETVEDEGRTTIRLVRTSALMRFRDDVTVWVSPHDGGSRVEAESRSRVGKGDLGQNPRNLRQLLDALRAELAK